MSSRAIRLTFTLDRRAALTRAGAISVGFLIGSQFLRAAAQSATPVARDEADGQRATINGVDLYFVERGDPIGPPMLMLHGGLGNSENWGQVWPTMVENGYRVILMDSRRQGRSGWGDEPLSFELMAADAVGLLDHLGILSADLVGWSDGAIVGLELAINHRDRLQQVVAYGANFTPDGLQELTPSDALNALFAQIASEYERLSPQPERFGELYAELEAMYQAAPNYSEEQLQGITTPFLILDGAKEELVKPDQPVRLASLIPGAQLKIMPDTGHFAPFEQPAEFSRIVLDFLATQVNATPTS
jgi:pimeloyl-ACP methyl ester carboxylesterase